MTKRRAGVLMPIFSLPSPYGIGTFGKDAYKFIDFLKKAGQKVWQVLPLVPTGFGDSPYSSSCSYAGNPYFIDVDFLKDDGLLSKAECESYSCDNGDNKIDYSQLFNKRIALLKLAFSRFDKENEDFKSFLLEGEFNAYSLFMAIKEKFDYKKLNAWDNNYKKRDKKTLENFEKENSDAVLFWQFTQFIFFSQWKKLKNYANQNGVQILGDLPLYMSDDSVDVWESPEAFQLNEDGFPSEVAGVPPDYFSEDGQLWGNPLYDWDAMKNDGYKWWNKRLNRALKVYDIVRIDHFRGFDRYYAVPYGSQTAKQGRWRDGPKENLFADKKQFNIIAEDLGVIDDGVRRLLKNTGFPGMKVLEFGFNGDENHEYKPSNYSENCVAYTGTHDNATFVEYFNALTAKEKEIFFLDLKRETERFNLVRKGKCVKSARKRVIELLYKSKANLVILPLADLLGLDGSARINRPGILSQENWTWRLEKGKLTSAVCKKYSDLAKENNR